MHQCENCVWRGAEGESQNCCNENSPYCGQLVSPDNSCDEFVPEGETVI